jgi:serine/threonine protein phosphatase 1
VRLYAIGDVHGHLGALRAAHARISADRERTGDSDAPVVHLGDYCDRGPDSAGVLEFLIEGAGAGAPWRFLRGNHDRLMEDFLAGPGEDDTAAAWIGGSLGGADTLASYGIEGARYRALEELRSAAAEAVPAAHKAFLDRLEPAIETDALFLVHAGIRPGIPLSEQDEHDLLWIRGDFLDDTRDHGKLVVHGHTPVELPMHCGNRIALDTGAAYGGPLTAAVFEGRACWILGEAGRIPLRPPGE